MDFELSHDQGLLRETVRRFLAKRAPINPYVRAQLDSDAGTTTEVWAGLAALGALGLLVSEEHGGTGMGMVEVGVVLEEMGRCVHPGPFASTAVGAASLISLAARPDERAALLPPLVAGKSIVAVALPPRRGSRTRTVTADGLRITGTYAHVRDAGTADVLLVVAAADRGLGVFAIERGADGLETIGTPTVDGTRREATVTLRETPGRRLDAGDATAAVAETRDRLVVGAVVDGLGAAAQALALAVDYAKVREQFGRPIGSFQAVQHLCADMLQAVELGRAAAYYACWACDAADAAGRRRATTIAAAFAGDAFYRAGASAIQVFGGVGFTWEHDAHLYYKRLLSLQQFDGAPHEHLEDLAEIILA